MKTEQIKYIWEVSHGQRGRILLSCLTGIIGVAVSSCFYLCFQGRHRHCHRCRHRKPDQCRYPYYRFVNRPTSVRSRRHPAQCPYASGNWKRTRHRLFSPSITSRWNELERFHTGDIVNRWNKIPPLSWGGTDQYNSGFHSYHRSVGSRIRILLLSRSVPALGSGRHSTYFPIG